MSELDSFREEFDQSPYPDMRRRPNREDLTGRKYGYLTVVKQAEMKHNRVQWECLCDCGNDKIVQASRLKHGDIISCGCTQGRRIVHPFALTKGQLQKARYRNTAIKGLWKGRFLRLIQKMPDADRGWAVAQLAAHGKDKIGE